MENNYLNFRKKNEKETELYIYGNIEEKTWIDDWLGTGKKKTDAFTLKDALMQVDTPNLTVRINSYGGDVSEGLAIYSLLSEFKGHLTTIVDGFACSAASVVFMAGQERIVPENGLLMIHNAWTEAKGDSNRMKKVAEDLEKITRPSIDIYVNKTKLTEEEIKAKMDKEEWITSQEAYEWGFSTTQERKKEYKQAVEADFVYNLVMKNKELQVENEELKEKNSVEKFKDTIKEATKEALKEKLGEQGKILLSDFFVNDIKEKQNKKDSWKSFFNTKN